MSSPFGSHASMLVADVLRDPVVSDGGRTLLVELLHPYFIVTCRDERGEYETYRGALDAGLADACRYDNTNRR